MTFFFLLASFIGVHAESSGKLTYKSLGETVEITGCAKTVVGALDIPSEIEGKPVVTLGGFPDKYSKALTHISIPESVAKINDHIFFYCRNLESFDVATSNPAYASIDGVLFSKDLAKLVRCPSAKSGAYKIPEGITSLDDSAFSFCGALTNIVLPESLTGIGSAVFFQCGLLEQIALPENLATIGARAFWACPLEEIHIPRHVASIGANALSYCNDLKNIEVAKENTHYRSVDGILFDRDLSRLIQCPRKRTGPCIIPQTVVSIDAEAFSLCKGLTEVVFPPSLRSIGQSAFQLCDGLRIIRIPASVEKIALSNPTFKRCRNLEAFVVEKDNLYYASKDGVLFDKNLKILIQYPAKKSGAYTVPEGVETISSSAFSYCSNLASIQFPESLSSIGSMAFYQCGSLTEVTIPDNTESIGLSAFNNCNRLTNITISAEIKGKQDSLSWSGGATVTIQGENPNYTSGDGVLFNKASTELIRCPVEKSGTYTVPEGITTIKSFAFANCKNLTGITLPDSLESIGAMAFSSCKNLKSISIPSNVGNIEHGGFYWCQQMESITVEDGSQHYASIEGVLFNKELTELIQFPPGRKGSYSIPNSVGTIKGLAFAASRLTKIELSESTSFIERIAFLMPQPFGDLLPQKPFLYRRLCIGRLSQPKNGHVQGQCPGFGSTGFP